MVAVVVGDQTLPRPPERGVHSGVAPDHRRAHHRGPGLDCASVGHADQGQRTHAHRPHQHRSQCHQPGCRATGNIRGVRVVVK
jgi:hypothetical protein